MLGKVAKLLIDLIDIYEVLLLAWILASWFPRFQSTKIYGYLDNIIYPYARYFRGIIPSLGGFDFSMILAFIVLNLAKSILIRFAFAS